MGKPKTRDESIEEYFRLAKKYGIKKPLPMSRFKCMSYDGILHMNTVLREFYEANPRGPKRIFEPHDLLKECIDYVNSCYDEKVIGRHQMEVVRAQVKVPASDPGFNCYLLKKYPDKIKAKWLVGDYRRNPDYKQTFELIDQLFRNHNLVGGATGDIASTFGKLILSNQGIVEQTHTSSANNVDEQVTTVNDYLSALKGDK